MKKFIVFAVATMLTVSAFAKPGDRTRSVQKRIVRQSARLTAATLLNVRQVYVTK